MLRLALQSSDWIRYDELLYNRDKYIIVTKRRFSHALVFVQFIYFCVLENDNTVFIYFLLLFKIYIRKKCLILRKAAPTHLKMRPECQFQISCCLILGGSVGTRAPCTKVGLRWYKLYTR